MDDQKICFFKVKKKIYLQLKSNIKQNITKFYNTLKIFQEIRIFVKP